MTRGSDFIKSGKCSHGHRSAMSNSAWCDSNKNCTVLKLRDMCHNPKCKCQKMITLLLINFNLKADRLNLNYKKYLRVHKQLGINSSKPLLMQQHRLSVWP